MPFRLGIVILPGPAESEWRQAIVAAGKARGAFLAKAVVALSTAASDSDVVLFVGSAAEADGYDATDWIVLSHPIEATAATVMARVQGNAPKLLRLASERLALVDQLVARGAIFLDAMQETITLPHLGEITREPTVGSPRSAPALGALEVYRQNPPVVGSRAEWGWDLFVFKTPANHPVRPPRIDLTGRGRVVVFGPRIDLPAGRWRVTAALNVETEGSDIYLRFQWGVGENLEELEVMLQHSGGYRVAIDHTWPQAGPAELRVWASNAHFVGQMEFLGVEVERVPDDDQVADALSETHPAAASK